MDGRMDAVVTRVEIPSSKVLTGLGVPCLLYSYLNMHPYYYYALPFIPFKFSGDAVIYL